MIPITGRASSFLELLKSNLNPNQIQSIFCSSFFLCLQGQSELCGSYHLLQSCFSFFVSLPGQLEPFGIYHPLQSCISFFFLLHDQLNHSSVLLFFSLHGQPVITSLQYFENGQALFLMVFLFYPFPILSFSRPILSLSYFRSSVCFEFPISM